MSAAAEKQLRALMDSMTTSARAFREALDASIGGMVSALPSAPTEEAKEMIRRHIAAMSTEVEAMREILARAKERSHG